MRIIPDQLKSKNLVPFKKRHGRYNIPGMTSENQVSMDRVDSDLSTEEQGYIRHYLGYADALIRSAEDAPLALAEEELNESSMMIQDRRREPPKEQPPPEEPAAAVVIAVVIEELESSNDDSAHKAA